MKRPLFLFCCLLILAIGINDVAAYSMIKVERDRNGVVGTIREAIVLIIDDKGRPIPGEVVNFFSGNANNTQVSATRNGTYTATIDVTTGTDGKATAYMKVIAIPIVGENVITAKVPRTNLSRACSIYTRGSIPLNTPPVFSDGDSTTRSIVENSFAGTNIGSAVGATDPNGDTLRYALTGTDASSFALDVATGQLKTEAALDYETKNSYSVTVSAYDNVSKAASASITVTINVLDGGENPPTFTEGDTATRSVAENQPVGTNIGAPLTATDPDLPEGDELRYRVDAPDPDDPNNPWRATLSTVFGIDNNGQLKTKIPMDYETQPNSYTVFVSVSDRTDRTDLITVTINVTDVEESGTGNNPPVFTEGTSAVRSLLRSEADTWNHAIGDPISATDADGHTLTYIMSGADSILLGMVSSTGQLRVSYIPPDRTSVNVTVTATDPTNLTDTISVTINIKDGVGGNTNQSPVFTDGTSTSRSIAENTAAGSNIGTPVAATDADNETIIYSLLGTDAALFGIDSSTGQLQTSAPLDYETKNSYAVQVAAIDPNGASANIDVTINVTDANDAPVFSDGTSTTLSIAENTAAGSNIGTPFAATDDEGHTITYSLGGTDSGAFGITSSSGQLQTSASLNYERKNSYTVEVTATDSNSASTSITVTINVTDVNESPVFSGGTSTSRSIAENTASGSNIGSRVSATDPDGDTLTYRLSGTDAASFRIVSSTGQLRTSAALDYETKISYSVAVTVSDSNGGSDSITVTINVTDVDESGSNPPQPPPGSNGAPVFTDGTSTSRSIAENTASGNNIGDPVSATDPDDDTITYALGGTDAAAFGIDSSTGQLRTSASLDYETKNSYSVAVAAYDGTDASASITVTINITDVDESGTDPPAPPPASNGAPVFTEGASTTRSVAENTPSGNNIGDLVPATDPDGDTITYSLGGTDAAAFGIDSSNAQLRTAASLDYETKSSYSVAVTAYDGNGASASITVTINITDVDETDADETDSDETDVDETVTDPTPPTPPDSDDEPVFTEGTSTTRSIGGTGAVDVCEIFTLTDTGTDEPQVPPMYWVDANVGAIQSLTGTDINRLAPDIQNATSVAVDRVNGKIYWTEQMGDGSGRIQRANLNGTNIQLVKELTSAPRGLAIDTSNNKLYLTNADGKVQRMNLDGTGFQPDLIVNLDAPRGVAVDAARGKVYWTEQTGDNSGRIRRANLNGTNVQLVIELQNVVHGLAIDTHTHKLYLASSMGKVQRLNVNGTDFEPNFIVNSNAPMSVAVDAADGKVYWTEGDRIRRANPNGTNIQNVATGLGSPVSLVLSPPAVEVLIAAPLRPPIYWRSQAGALQRLTATEVEGIAPTAQNIIDIAVDARAGNVYWTERTSNKRGRIRRANLNGTNVQLVKELTSVPRGIALDTSSNKLYLTNADGKMQRMNLDGTGFQPDLIVDLDAPRGVAVDAAGGKVYWTERTSNKRGRIRRANLNGTNVQLIRKLTGVPRSIALDTSKGKLYLTNDQGKVQRMNLDGTSFQPDLIVNLNSPQGIAVDVAAKSVYWTERSSIRRADLDSCNIEDVVTGLRSPVSLVLSAAPAEVLIAAPLRPPIYWYSQAGALQRLTATEVEGIAPTAQNITGIAVDVYGGKVYWTEQTSNRTGRIRRANLNGTNVQLVKELTSVPRGIALDTSNNKLYLTNAWGKVQRMDLNGEKFQPNVVVNLESPGGIAVDAADGKVYWTEQTGKHTGSVRRADLDGSNVESVRELNNVPYGITVDASKGKLYVTNSRGNVQRFNVDGSNFEGNFIVKLDSPQDIAIDAAGRKVYWTDRNGIQRANLDGSNIQDVVTGLMAPGAIAISGATATETTPPATTAAQSKYDVDGDGTIGNVDAVLVAGALGTNNLQYDLNADGSVDFLDLLLIFANFEETAGAPSGIVMKFTAVQIDNIREQIELLEATNDRSPEALRTLVYLRRLLASASPAKTQLLANYPNPFNPETWIPYELETDAHVRIVIYNTRGTVVRQLDLGHQREGYYTGKGRAAYWDGRNAVGERVASGIYLYQLQADNLSFLRKMVILK